MMMTYDVSALEGVWKIWSYDSDSALVDDGVGDYSIIKGKTEELYHDGNLFETYTLSISGSTLSKKYSQGVKTKF